MGITYEEGREVCRGNLLYPRQVSEPPLVSLPLKTPCEEGDGLYTLVLTNPDGHLQDNKKEVLHWMM